MKARPNWSEGRALCRLDWSMLDDKPHRVALPYRQHEREVMDNVIPWLQERYAGRESDEVKLFSCVLAGRWLIFGFVDQTDAAMFSLLHGGDWEPS